MPERTRWLKNLEKCLAKYVSGLIETKNCRKIDFVDLQTQVWLPKEGSLDPEVG